MRFCAFVLYLLFSMQAYAETNNYVHPCRAKIQDMVFLADPNADAQSAANFVSTQTFDPKYLLRLQSVFDFLPEHSKNAFCYIEKIFILTNSPYVGYTGVSYKKLDTKNAVQRLNNDSGTVAIKPNGFYLYLHESLFFEKIKGSEDVLKALSTKAFNIKNTLQSEQLYNLQIKNLKPQAYPEEYSAFINVLLHEIGHMVEFSERLTQAPTLVFTGEKNNLFFDYWLSLSWSLKSIDEYSSKLLPDVDDALLGGYFRSPDGYDLQQLGDLYKKLQSSPFSSMYSLANFQEDFAEHYAFAMSDEHFIFEFDGEIIFDTKENKSDLYREKTALIQNLSDDVFARIKKSKPYILETDNVCSSWLKY